jgi:hypothetical protein
MDNQRRVNGLACCKRMDVRGKRDTLRLNRYARGGICMDNRTEYLMVQANGCVSGRKKNLIWSRQEECWRVQVPRKLRWAMASFLFREASLEYHGAPPLEFHLGVPPGLELLCGSDETTRCCAVVLRWRFKRHLHTIGLVRFTAEQSHLKELEDEVIIDQISPSCMS